jgi:hypothetical protein
MRNAGLIVFLLLVGLALLVSTNRFLSTQAAPSGGLSEGKPATRVLQTSTRLDLAIPLEENVSNKTGQSLIHPVDDVDLEPSISHR